MCGGRLTTSRGARGGWAWDIRGFGSPPLRREPISVENYGRFLDELMDRLDIAAAPVVGNSMGGFAAGELAIKFPPRVERLVLVSAARPAPKDPGPSTGVFPPPPPPRVAPAGNAYPPIPEARAAHLGRPPRPPPRGP